MEYGNPIARLIPPPTHLLKCESNNNKERGVKGAYLCVGVLRVLWFIHSLLRSSADEHAVSTLEHGPCRKGNDDEIINETTARDFRSPRVQK